MSIADTIELQRAAAASRCVSLLHFAQDIDVTTFDALSELEQFDLEFGRPIMLRGSWREHTEIDLATARACYYADHARRCYRLACGGQ